MWDGLLLLILLCIALFATSFLIGLLPLSLSLSSRKLSLVSALGTGVLVGTALIVIIPEGIETLYSAEDSSHGHTARSVALTTRTTPIRNDVGTLANNGRRIQMMAVPIENDMTSDLCVYLKKRQEDSGNQNEESGDADDELPDHEEDAIEDHEPRDPHAWVGVSLITGFILMYLIDTLPRHAISASQPQRFHVSLGSFSLTRGRTSSVAPETPTTSTHTNSGSSSRPSSTTTVGLVIHAIADGIALGASSTTTSRLSFIIFVALMIHKAPAAFGLTSVLLKQGLSTRAARAHLIVFSLAAPVGALLTWASAHLLGYSSSALGNSASTEFATGVLLLFSAGTFLYVAMHTMQENSEGHDHGEAQGNGYVGVPMTDIYGGASTAAPQKQSGRGVTDTLVTVVGMLIPLLTQFGHAH